MPKRKNDKIRGLDTPSTDALSRFRVSFNEEIQSDESCPTPEELLIQEEEGEPNTEATLDDCLERLDPTCTRSRGGLIGLSEIADAMDYSEKQAEKLIFSLPEADFIYALVAEYGVVIPRLVKTSRRKNTLLISTQNSGENFGNNCRTMTREKRRKQVPGWFKVNSEQ